MAQQLIESVFSPFVAVSTSDDAEQVCRRNNLSFVELVKPFSDAIEVSLKDPSGSPQPPTKVRLNFRHLQSSYPQAPHTKKMLSEAVYSHLPDDTTATTTVNQGLYDVQVCPSTPWYSAYRDAFFQTLSPLEHDFTRHYLACIFVVSTSHSAPQQQLQHLIQNLSSIQLNLSHHSKWFFTHVAHYYVLLHDAGTGDSNMAEATLLSMKNLYGSSNCHMLTINSVSPSNPPSEDVDIWSAILDPGCQNGVDRTVQYQSGDTNGVVKGGNSTPSPVGGVDHPLLSNSPSPTPDFEIHTSPTAGQRRGTWLTTTDRESVKTFVSDFGSQCLAPFAEQQLRSLHEQVSNKKGLHRSFANAAKSFFGGRGKANMLSSNNPSAVNSVIYSQQAPELQVRKLGDLAFLFHQYDVAYNAYHSAKRDFNGDQAWLYCAGAEEMAALSVFMLGKNSPRAYPTHYFDNAVNTYMTVCKVPQLATRATLLHAECLRSLEDYQTLANQLIRMTSEESDLRSALLLEQASYCFLKTDPLQVRKYAFHLVLAGHRFSKAGMRKHSLRAYKEAGQVYSGREWSVAEDHIMYIIGRQCAAIGRPDEAFKAFHKLLDKNSQQSAHQQSLFLKEYLTTVKAGGKHEFDMPLPSINMDTVRTILGPANLRVDLLSNREDWPKLEECCYLRATAQKKTPYNYKNCVDVLDHTTANTQSPMTVLNEPITVELTLTNPLQISLTLAQCHLSWEFEVDSGERVTNHKALTTNDSVTKADDFIETRILDYVSMEAQQTIVIKLSLLPKRQGRLEILGISYQVCPPTVSPSPSANSVGSDQIIPSPMTELCPGSNPVWGHQTFLVKGPKEKNAKRVKDNQWYAKDFRLQPIVGPAMPYLKVEFDNFPTQLLCGEVKRLTLRLTNLGSPGLHKLFVASKTPKDFTFGADHNRNLPPSHATYKEMSAKGEPTNSVSHCEGYQVNYVTSIPGCDSIEPGCSLSVPIWIRGPDIPGDHEVLMSFYHESMQPTGVKQHHRVTKFSAKVTTISSLILHSNAESSMKADDAGSLLLSVHAKNSSELEGCRSVDISLLQVSCMSEIYSINKHIDVPPKTPTHSVVTTIRPREVKDITLKLTNKRTQLQHGRTEDGSGEERGKSMKIMSQWPLSIVRVESSVTPCAEFMMASSCKLGELRDENVPLTSKEILDIEVAKIRGTVKKEQRDPLDLTVSIIWKAAVERDGAMQVVMGQHHVNLRDLRVTFTSIPASVNRKKNLPPIGGPLIHLSNNQAAASSASQASKLVLVSLLHCDYTEHDFSKSKFLSLEVTLLLHNPSVDTTISLSVDCIDQMGGLPRMALLPQPNGGTAPGQNSNPLTPFNAPTVQDYLTDDIGGFIWTSKARVVRDLQPAATEKIPLKAMFLSTGTYNVSSGLQITLNNLEQPKSLTPCQSLIVITNAANR